ncbi:hypothetical protein [Pontimicrobium sp. MEBiC01747]
MPMHRRLLLSIRRILNASKRLIVKSFQFSRNNLYALFENEILDRFRLNLVLLREGHLANIGFERACHGKDYDAIIE